MSILTIPTHVAHPTHFKHCQGRGVRFEANPAQHDCGADRTRAVHGEIGKFTIYA